MSYDADKTAEILDELKTALRKDDLTEAMQILRFADGSGAIRRGSGMLPALQKQIGEKQAQRLIYAFATDPCPYCKGGREKCDDCGGKGFYSGTKVCQPCAGLGLKRCPFCNGTAFAGYDFVPRGLRQIVLLVRTDFAAQQLRTLANPEAATSERPSLLARRILAIDRCRGIFANAVEQARIIESRAANERIAFASTDRTRIDREARQQNRIAEKAIRHLLQLLGERSAKKAQASQKERTRELFAHRAKIFARLSTGEGFDSSALETPAALRS
ncbi:MAG: hypothetical protein KF691_15490 [Phycisphaeraceae bacterium]|nr:hypothetical protein [Phycisphaeraceae bacterium]